MLRNLIEEIFSDEELVEKIKKRLPYLFQLAEMESSRAGKTGMEVSSIRERIIVALLIYKFGEANVETEIPIAEPEVDVRLFGKPAEPATKVGHPAPFPVELPYRLIQLYTFEGDVVLDQFIGSGQKAIAALKTRRHYVGYEINENYVKLAER